MTSPCLTRAWERFLTLLPLFTILACLALWILAALTLGQLDRPWPAHFDAAGVPDRMAEPGDWWQLPAIGTFIFLMMLGVVRLVRWLVERHPEWVNLPRKAAFMALPREARARITPRLSQLVMGIALITNLVMLAIVRDTWRVATEQLTHVAMWKVMLLLGLMLLWTIVAVVRIAGAIRRETDTVRNPGLVLGDP